MGLQKTLASIVLASAIGSGGCDNLRRQYVTGTVLKESGTIVDRQKLIGNHPTYAIQFRADDGKVYTFAVTDSYTGSNLNKLEALNFAIEEGTRIRMTKYNFDRHLAGTVGLIDDDELEVLGK